MPEKSNRLIKMNDVLRELVDGDVGIVIVLAPDGLLGECDGDHRHMGRER